LLPTPWISPSRNNGSWRDVGNGTLRSNATGLINLPDFPENIDWGLRLILEEPASPAPQKKSGE
jgi:hypothetical protein